METALSIIIMLLAIIVVRLTIWPSDHVTRGDVERLEHALSEISYELESLRADLEPPGRDPVLPERFDAARDDDESDDK